MAGIEISRMNDAVGTPTALVIPSGSFGYVNATILAGGSTVVKHSGDPTGSAPPGSEAWVIGSRPVMSCAIYPSLNATLEISISAEGTLFAPFESLPLYHGTINAYSGLFCPGMAAMFTIVNADSISPNVVFGTIKIQGVD